MNTYEIIKDNEGKPAFYKVPIADLEAFEDARDALEAEEILHRIKSGEEETFPMEIVDRIVLNDENPVRVYREHRSMTQQALADATGLTQASIHRAEQTNSRTSAVILKKIAEALNVDLDMLV